MTTGKHIRVNLKTKRLRWSTSSVLAFGTQVRGRPKPSDFSGRKSPQRAFLRNGSKAVCSMS